MPKVQLLERFFNGWRGYYVAADGTTGSVSFRSDSIERCIPKAINGCVVLDKSACGKDGIFHVINCPLVDITLDANTIRHIDGHKSTAVVLPKIGGNYGLLAAKALADKQWAGSDSISLDLYVEAWKNLGARVGRIMDNKITWDN